MKVIENRKKEYSYRCKTCKESNLVQHKLMCDFYSQILDFRGEFLSFGGQEKYFLVSI